MGPDGAPADMDSVAACYALSAARVSAVRVSAAALGVALYVLNLAELLDPQPLRADVEKAYKALALQHHPDRGGDGSSFIALKRSHEAQSKRARPCGGVGTSHFPVHLEAQLCSAARWRAAGREAPDEAAQWPGLQLPGALCERGTLRELFDRAVLREAWDGALQDFARQGDPTDTGHTEVAARSRAVVRRHDEWRDGLLDTWTCAGAHGGALTLQVALLLAMRLALCLAGSLSVGLYEERRKQ